MSSRKERKQFNGLTSRIFVFLLGFSAIAVGFIAFSANYPTGHILSITGYALATIGFVGILSSLLLDDATIIKFSESTGNSEILVIFVLLALFLAWAAGRLKKRI
jgi:hypothetical protein